MFERNIEILIDRCCSRGGIVISASIGVIGHGKDWKVACEGQILEDTAVAVAFLVVLALVLCLCFGIYLADLVFIGR